MYFSYILASMLKKILITLALLICIGTFAVFGFAIYTERQEFIEHISLLSSQDLIHQTELTTLKEKVTLLESQYAQDEKYLTYSGTLHYIPLD